MTLDPTLPSLEATLFKAPTLADLAVREPSRHAPRFLLLYGSLRERSHSRLLTFEAARLLTAMGGEVQIFDPAGLPMPGGAPDTHPKVQELRRLAEWSEGMVWCSPERHGAMTGILKAQIDWIPLESARCGRRRARPWQSWRCPAARSPSTPSTRCTCSVAGCG